MDKHLPNINDALIKGIDANIKRFHEILIEGDLNAEQFEEVCAAATDAIITRARLTSLWGTQ